MTATAGGAEQAIGRLAGRHRLRPLEALPWVIAIAAYFLFPDYLPLGAQVLIMVLFALSLDLILGYGGIITLGQAAFFGVGGYTAGLLGAHGWSEPITGLLAAGAVAGAFGVVTGLIVLRTEKLTLLMLTLMVNVMLYEAANKASTITGGSDGLQGVVISPVLGLFRFDIFGRTAYLYALAVLFLAWLLVRRIVHSPFGRSLTGIRENVARMHAIGSPVLLRRLTAYTIAAALSGVAGALLTQATQFVGQESLSVDRSGGVLIVLILGGFGRLYGAFVGAPLYMIAQDRLSALDPSYWPLAIGALLIAVVMLARGGVLGICDTLIAWLRRRGRP
ncbi:MAG TPA: branched-chain amino acid ABC transporter permease [Stellaceae bacterium]|nr:branched-chain amino acid ABC transporter permease [Stellaceae bacterium]